MRDALSNASEEVGIKWRVVNVCKEKKDNNAQNDSLAIAVP